MEPQTGHAELKELMVENQRLLVENNQLLRKMHRSTVRHFWLHVVYVVIFLGLPIIILYKFILPVYDSFGGSERGLTDQLKDAQELKNFLEEQR